MAKRVTRNCDGWHTGNEGFPLGKMPNGWLACSFYNESWYRYCFCGYSCLVVWAERRENHRGNKYAVITKEVNRNERNN